MPSDALQPLFEHFRLRAQTFFTGNLCAVASFEKPQDHGHLHLVRAGRGEIRYQSGRKALRIEGPGLLFYPRNLPHHLVPEGPEGLDLVCATITFGLGVGCPLALALPEVMHLGVGQVGPLAELIFQEAFGTAQGRQAVVDRLCEVVLVHFVRQALEAGQAQAGLMAGLMHPQLRNALTALHADPARAWSLEDMAAEAGLSRSAFAALFKQTVGTTPGEHLARFRVATAQERLARGLPLKVVAYDVGYGSSTALSRAFRELTGLSPRAWLDAQRS
ncbi:AraC family transcriptional regulator [Geothrix limicola]|uniref:AraC family transcriptional regulator n=1 Tax=Geothrix limicola TaxID=2927978 RepID=A0ABQ5QEX5_9BACT|nr:AraC family transcriptional regulator [Geothrix limicola]GLH73129.1 AraC family transcriptional regulator [Geothrix limicola]